MPFFGIANANGRPMPPPSTVPSKRHVRELYHPDQMAAVLRRERARSDRQQCGFSLVLFRLESAPFRERSLLRLAAVLLKLIRETDELGRYDHYTLCAVLPDTDPTGAAMLVSRLQRVASARAEQVSCTIYTYPDPPQDGRPFIADEAKAVQPVRPSVRSADEEDDDNDSPTGGDSSDDSKSGVAVGVTGEAGSVPTVAMSALFAEPLPIWKRVIDIALAGSAILATAPLMIAAAIAVKWSSPMGPVIFRQTRTGLGGVPFTIYKFRTMIVDAERKQAALRALSEQDGPAFKLKDDPRIFTAGKWLRKLSIDELPQLFNVLLGDMTLVGPRPLPVHEADACRSWQRNRHDVTPGLTCIWQVEGRSRVKFDEWMRMDMRYARGRSIVADLSLVFRTIPAVLLRRGAN